MQNYEKYSVILFSFLLFYLFPLKKWFCRTGIRRTNMDGSCYGGGYTVDGDGFADALWLDAGTKENDGNGNEVGA